MVGNGTAGRNGCEEEQSKYLQRRRQCSTRSNVRLGNKSAQVAQSHSSNTPGCRGRLRTYVWMVGELRTYTKSRGRTAYVHAGSGITY